MIEGWLKFLYLMLCLMLVAYSPLYADCIDGDCVDGKILSGQFKKNRLDGHGTMIWPDGRKENVEQTNDSTFKVIFK
jgi:hypothetical protein